MIYSPVPEDDYHRADGHSGSAYTLSLRCLFRPGTLEGSRGRLDLETGHSATIGGRRLELRFVPGDILTCHHCRIFLAR
jgi:hypothetical protein